jgi:hypothetical protein
LFLFINRVRKHTHIFIVNDNLDWAGKALPF